MIILFGSRTYLRQLAILTLVCGRCGNPSAHSLRKRVVKFTLFFVPLFPLSVKYSTQCTYCGAVSQLPKDQATALLAQIETAAAPSPAAGAPGTPAPQARGGQPPAGHRG